MNATRDGYEVDEERMAVVRRAFRIVGVEGAGIYSVHKVTHVDGDFVVPAGHLLGALMSFLGTGSALIALSRRMAADPRWRSVAPYALGSGIAIVALFVATFAFVIPPSAPLHPWRGLVQRATLARWFPCTVVLALRLLRVTKATVATR